MSITKTEAAVPSDDVARAGPPWQLLTERLHYNLSEGLIWLDDRRVLTLSAQWFGELRSELLRMLGRDAARGLLTRLGHSAGSRDAEAALKLHGRAGLRDVILAGIQFHALQGSVQVVPTVYEVDLEAGRCHLEFEWHHSVEDQAHLDHEGLASEPVCWMEVGYAAGFLSTCMGRPVAVREVACHGMGASSCRCEARTVEAGEIDGDEHPPLPGALHHLLACGTQAAAQSALTPARDAGAAAGGGVIGSSTAFNTVMHQVRRVAATNATVLLLGESGVGKSAFAREIHRMSRRSQRPLLEVNCAAIPENLIESELFGVERGAYTGAQATRVGRFEDADGGALFLDEIGCLSLTAQGKLLRILQSQEFERLGSNRTRKADVRILAATNEDLEQAVKAGRFRLDLFFRLSVFPIRIPPLRERRNDIPPLLVELLRRYCALHLKQVPGFTARAIRALLAHDWPGNIRELENVIERGVILADPDAPLDLPQLFTVDMSFEKPGLLELQPDGSLGQLQPQPDTGQLPQWLREQLENGAGGLFGLEEQVIRCAVAECGGNVAAAARLLKISRAQIDYRLKRMSPSRAGPAPAAPPG